MELIRQVCAVVGVLLLAAAFVWWLRGRGLGAPVRRELSVVERLSLTPHHAVFLVRVCERVMVIGTAPSGFQVLATLEVPKCGG